jgi:hypothetical protein
MGTSYLSQPKQYCYNAGAKRTWTEGSSRTQEQGTAAARDLCRKVEEMEKDKVKEEGVMISSDHRSLRLYGDVMREWRRGAEGNVKEEDWEGAKAGEEGPVMGGVAVR